MFSNVKILTFNVSFKNWWNIFRQYSTWKNTERRSNIYRCLDDIKNSVTLIFFISHTQNCFITIFWEQKLGKFSSTMTENPCESQSENYMSYVKKSQLSKKNIKLRIEVAEDPQKHIFEVNYRFWVLSCVAIRKIVFFSKSWDFFI